jgi:serine phosphatase RsbU (regulator of sigma subunit)
MFRSGCSPETLPGDGRFLGMIEELYLTEYTVELRPGDRLLLYSDGATDMLSESGEAYGLDRLTLAFRAAGDSSNDVLGYLTRDIQQWRGNAPAYDDVTMLLMEALPV